MLTVRLYDGAYGRGGGRGWRTYARGVHEKVRLRTGGRGSKSRKFCVRTLWTVPYKLLDLIGNQLDWRSTSVGEIRPRRLLGVVDFLPRNHIAAAIALLLQLQDVNLALSCHDTALSSTSGSDTTIQNSVQAQIYFIYLFVFIFRALFTLEQCHKVWWKLSLPWFVALSCVQASDSSDKHN